MGEKKHGIKKVIGLADVHIPNSRGLDEIREVMSAFFKQAKEIVKEAGGPEYVRIVVAGDVYDMKLDVTNESELLCYWFFQELDKICPTIIIAGNHYLNMMNLTKIDSITPIFEMSTFNQLRYLDREFGYKSGYVKDDNIVWCLYSTFSEFEKPNFVPDKALNTDPAVKYIGLIHGEINGATTAVNHVSEAALSPTLFDGTDFVIAGHIHRRQEIPGNGTKIVYCSSLKQKNFGETVSGHGFVIYDVESGDYEFVDTPNNSGVYKKYVINSLDDIDNDKEILTNE